MTRLIVTVLLCFVAATASAQEMRPLPPPAPSVQFAPGKYLIPFAGLIYTASSPTRVLVVNGLLQWRIEMYDLSNVYQGTQVIHWGNEGDVVLPARDYDGDGYDDPAVYRPATGMTYVLRSSCPSGPGYFWSCYYALGDH